MTSTSPGKILSGNEMAIVHHHKEKPSGSNVAFIDHQSCKNLLLLENTNAIPFSSSKVTTNANVSDCERLYDDPCELLEEWNNSPSKLPRSRSWLCCPHASTNNKNVFQGNNDGQIPFITEYSNLVTEAPKPQAPSFVRFLRL